MTDGVVFVHGGGHGRWCWDAVRAGLSVPSVAVDLPGRGERPHDGTVVTLDRCVDAVLEDVAAAGFERFVLVGHSLGGLTITELAHRHPERVDHLVYLDAVAYPEGVNQLTFMEQVLGFVPEIDDPAGLSPGFDRETARALFMSDLDDEAFEAAYARLTPEPYGLWLASVSGLAPQVPTTYVRCTTGSSGGAHPKRFTIELLREHCADLTYVEVESDHDVMLSHPEAVRAQVEEIARNGRLTVA